MESSNWPSSINCFITIHTSWIQLADSWRFLFVGLWVCFQSYLWRSLWVRYTSFTVQPFDLSSWRYVCLLGFGLYSNLTRHLALYQVSVRRLDRFATPLPSPRPHGLRLAVCYTWRQIPVVGLSPTRCAPCPTHIKKVPYLRHFFAICPAASYFRIHYRRR